MKDTRLILENKLFMTRKQDVKIKISKTKPASNFPGFESGNSDNFFEIKQVDNNKDFLQMIFQFLYPRIRRTVSADDILRNVSAV